jgi:hypothetical protein
MRNHQLPMSSEKSMKGGMKGGGEAGNFLPSARISTGCRPQKRWGRREGWHLLPDSSQHNCHNCRGGWTGRNVTITGVHKLTNCMGKLLSENNYHLNELESSRHVNTGINSRWGKEVSSFPFQPLDGQQLL